MDASDFVTDYFAQRHKRIDLDLVGELFLFASSNEPNPIPLSFLVRHKIYTERTCPKLHIIAEFFIGDAYEIRPNYEQDGDAGFFYLGFHCCKELALMADSRKGKELCKLLETAEHCYNDLTHLRQHIPKVRVI